MEFLPLSFVQQIESSSIAFDALVYNEMMTLYMSVGQLEKVLLVVEGMKRKKVPIDIFTYNLWISSYAAALNMDRVGKVLDEMSRDPNYSAVEGWERYRNLVNVYVASGLLTNSEGENGLVEAEEKRFSQREWITYDLLIVLYVFLCKNAMRIDFSFFMQVLLASTQAAIPPEQYRKSVLPSTRMPNAIKDILYQTCMYRILSSSA